MSLQKLPSGRWQARWRDPDGRQRARNFIYKADAAAFLNVSLGDMRRGTYVTPSGGRLKFTEWVEQWLTSARDLSRGTLDTYRRDLQRHILPELGHLRLEAITPLAIDRYLTKQLAAGVAPSSVHRHYRTLHRAFAVAVERRVVPANPCTPVKPPRVEDTEMRFLTAAEIEELADVLTPDPHPTSRLAQPSGRYRAWVLTMAYSGIRWSEAVGLQRRHVDGDRLTVIDQLVQRMDRTFERDRTKTKAGRRVVTLPDSVAEELERHLGTFSGPGPDGLVFPNAGGRPLQSSSFRSNVWVPACGRAGLAVAVVDEHDRPVTPRRWTGAPRPHDLRHTHAALAIAAGAHPKALQSRLGHASIQMTLGRYGHLYPEMDPKIAVELERIRPGLRLVS